MVATAPGLADAFARLGRERDPSAWALVVDLIGSDLRRTALRLTGDHALAADAVQEALLHLRDGAARFRPAHPGDDEGARRWALRVGANAALMLRRSRQRQRRREVADLAEPGGGAAPDEALQRAEEASAVRSALAELPEPTRAVLVLHHLEGLSLPEVATTLGVPVGTVKSRLHRGGADLRRRLERVGVAAGLAALGLADRLPAAEAPAAWKSLLTAPVHPTTPAISGGTAMLTLVLTSAAAIGAVAVPAALWLTLQAPAVQLVAPIAGAATTAAVAPVPAPVAAQPDAGAVLRGRISGPVAQVLARLRRDGGLDVRDRTWLDEGRPRLVDIDAGAGLVAREVLARMAEQAGLIVEPGPGGQLVVGLAPLTAAMEQALVCPVTISADEMPLREFIGQLGRKAHLPLAVFPDPGEASITLKVKDMKCRDVLNWAASMTGLEWAVGPGGLRLAAPCDAGGMLLAVEPEGALLRRFLAMGPAEFLRRALPEAGWKDGAPSDLRLPDGSDLLELPACGPDGDLVLTLLRGLSRCRSSDPWDFIESLHRERGRLIDVWKMKELEEKRLLARPHTFDLHNASLEDMVVAVRAQSQLNVVVLPGLLASGSKNRYTIQGAGIPLSQVLDLLRAAGLAWAWRGEALVFSAAADGQPAPAGEPQPNRSPLSGTVQPLPLDLPHRPGPAGAG